MGQVEVRWASGEDRASWVRLRRALWPDCPDVTHRIEVDQALARGGGALLAYHESSGAVGFAEVSVRSEHVDGASSSPVGYLEGWFVDEAFRGRGVGKTLVEAAVAWAAEHGLSELASDAALTNVGSQAAHEALGFVEVGRSVHFVRKI